MITGELKGILSIKIKSRHDGYIDQFNRIFIVKVLILCSLVMGINWYKEAMNCIVPNGGPSSDFVKPTCWIQGVYIYEELEKRPRDAGYYGLPKNMELDGVYPSGALCSTTGKYGYITEDCKPLTKKFFLQYQYLPFYVAILAVLFYIPYIFYLYGNNDLMSLKKSVKSGEADADAIVQSYFNHTTNPVRQLRLRIFFNIFIKVMYLAANLVAFLGTDKLMNGKFQSYGSKWIKWSKLSNNIRHDYIGLRDSPKPGNELLPPFGFCELYEQALDNKVTVNNYHIALCEVSQNILYQYCLILIWFTLVAGIIVSSIGLLAKLLEHLLTILFVLKHGAVAKKMYKVLTLRECEYLEFIRRRNIPLYAEVIHKLKMGKFSGRKISNGNGGDMPYNETPPPGFNEAIACL